MKFVLLSETYERDIDRYREILKDFKIEKGDVCFFNKEIEYNTIEINSIEELYKLMKIVDARIIMDTSYWIQGVNLPEIRICDDGYFE